MQYKVLIVDDEPLAAQALARMCKFLGHDPYVATESGAAVRRLRQDPPDIVLLDVNMPGISGLDLCDFIKHDARLKAIPVVFISLNDQDEAIQAGLDAGAADYLIKPVDIDRLGEVIDQLLRGDDIDS
jgi:DNA-binding response OmpR family regulator